MRIAEPLHVTRAKRDTDHCPICRAMVVGVSEYAGETRKGLIFNFCSKDCEEKAARIERDYDDFMEDAYWDRQYELWRDGEL
jgi:hypothetical protein